jgi:hypothetical protein
MFFSVSLFKFMMYVGAICSSLVLKEVFSVCNLFDFMQAPPNYKEPDFETPALQHRKVKLTFDDDEPDRKKALRQKFKGDQVKLILIC